MYFEQIARITRDHAREHLEQYLKDANVASGDKLNTLILPKSFEVSAILGGTTGIAGKETLPALAIVADRKQNAGSAEDLMIFTYSGVWQGLVAGTNADNVEKTAKRYAAACEQFFLDHMHHPYDPAIATSIAGLPFSFNELFYSSTTLFGAGNVAGPSGGTMFWVDGFRIDFGWLISENGPFQHDWPTA